MAKEVGIKVTQNTWYYVQKTIFENQKYAIILELSHFGITNPQKIPKSELNFCHNNLSYLYLPGVYIAESAHPKIRNNLTVLPSMFFRLGTWFVWTIGYFLSWRNTALLCMIPNIVVILCLIPLPESPYWLIECGKKNQAK